MEPLHDYERQVYAGVLGKVIGVYMGRPFEGWTKARIEERWGLVDRYVHEDLGKPLVVPDDDISGTLTFVRALADSGLLAETPEAFFGDTWLNYLIEGRTVLWWGGMGHSTEHTAYLRLKHGIKAPASGAIATNGRTVAEQIGAQIFIDAFGLVTPGKPRLAAELARRSARVSHDGEAVWAAMVVAGMISAAFVEKDMGKLLDLGSALIPAGSLIAQVHRDIRAWCREDGDWRRTYDRIAARYGYSTYGGNCHVIPNHALMVMAWSYAPNDFHRSQAIINTAGWDTDCNAANVGALMGLVTGLDGLGGTYDFRGPMADRIILPTAEGTRGMTDCLAEALHLASLGRRIMGWPQPPAPKEGAWHHFSQPGARHGYAAEEGTFETRGTVRVEHAMSPAVPAGALRLDFATCRGKTARVSTPVLPPAVTGGYGIQATPRVYTGMTLRADCQAADIDGAPQASLFVRFAAAEGTGALVRGPAVDLAAGPVTLSMDIPDGKGLPVGDVGIAIESPRLARGTLLCDRVVFGGTPRLAWPDGPPLVNGTVPGWIVQADVLRGSFSDDREPVRHVGRNEGRGILVTGTTDWQDYTISARVSLHLAALGGIVARYQGLERYLALVQAGDRLRLLRRWYGEDLILGEIPCRWEHDELHALSIDLAGDRVTACCDGTAVCTARDTALGRGGAGMVFANGLIGCREVSIAFPPPPRT